jgi:hypothetical protein
MIEDTYFNTDGIIKYNGSGDGWGDGNGFGDGSGYGF